MPKPGTDTDGLAKTEICHSMKCPGCGEWFDIHDLHQVMVHIHDARSEIVEGDTPPARPFA
jgi:hypothetical protein